MHEKPAPNVNSWLEEELHNQYLRDRQAVDSGWKQVFESNGQTAAPPNGTTAVVEKVERTVAPGEQLVPLRGPALRIAENMTASLTIPAATSQRAMPVKVVEENRRVINQHRRSSPIRI